MRAATKTRNRRTEMGEESGVFRVGDARGDVVSGRGLLGVESACGGFHFLRMKSRKWLGEAAEV